MVDSHSTTTDYTKLTVPQLKARCKELKIIGYSKLGKAALLEKLAQHVGTSALIPSSSTPVTANAADSARAPSQDLLVVAPALKLHPQTSAPALPASNPGFPTSCREEDVPAFAPILPANLKEAPTTFSVDSNTALPQAEPAQTKNKKGTAAKRQRIDPPSVLTPAFRKKQKLADKAPIRSKAEATAPVARPAEIPTKKPSFAPLAPKLSSNIVNRPRPSEQNLIHLSAATAQSSVHNHPSTRPSSATVNSSSRFRPPMLRPKDIRKPASLESPPMDMISIEQFSYLDFNSIPSSLPPSSFQPISIPPSLSQRKRINAWSVILSGLSDAERRECVLVSRAFRYAVYLSAVPIITRVFGGRIFTQLPRQYNMAMTNFWPYLKQLRLELNNQKRAYSTSFLPRFFGEHMPIGDDIWGCLENAKQLTVALRFIMTRVWFTISVNGRDRAETKNSVVMDAREILKDEIWSITVVSFSTSSVGVTQKTFYVLEPTCEVIGLPPSNGSPVAKSELSGSSASALVKVPCLRVDWSDYVEHRMPNVEHADRQPSLLNHLKWTNTEEYTKGISKLWLARVAKEGEVGEYKKRVAERYVVACVVGNSVSGQWMSSSHMAQVFAGMASESDPVPTSLLRKRDVQRVNLFLPAHHLVESVHFTTSGSKVRHLHPALASVQTPGREYFILRDNGMEVGCEEDGVWPAWMELLDCDARGIERS